ncbi:UDP-2,4-diacetamido-2,4,6-trideoxy-beta-L-altropyranose hydrolase [Donghicola sp. XS_ASV15]|uniref:UDP-2,4-diacetamido-2,4, 6-trideoxy-beta-L-altropyranose hydrolase n=1 Tax=Donghicola sp. XS_ASV15 TaxID=3241295 RepID=UPI0035190E5D
MATALIAFRADASLEIGSGHVVRCLTLAKALREAGAECLFLSRDLEGSLCDRIRSEGFSCHLLPAPVDADLPAGGPAHARWAKVSWEQDAQDCAAALKDHAVDWLIMDHYAFDRNWQSAMRPYVERIMVWDDLADRAHDCDVLLDQNLGTMGSDYDALLADHVTRLIGPKYAQLRPEFAAQRAEALVSRCDRTLTKVLIAMGGVDQHNATGRILEALGAWKNAASLEVSVVLGRQAPHLDALAANAGRFPFPLEIACDVTDMGHRMVEADLAIGAVGGTTWERCALGLPTLMLTIAANQIPAAQALGQTGAAILLGDETSEHWQDALAHALDRLSEPDALARMSEVAAGICDGDGTARLVRELVQADVSLRTATQEDARRVWEWRREGGANRYYRSQQEPPYPDHWNWFQRALRAQTTRFWVLEQGALPLGYVRLDLTNADRAFVSLCLAEDARGRGIGLSGLVLAEAIASGLKLTYLDAEIHPDNHASAKVFEKAGYARTGMNEGFNVYQRKVQART